MSEGWQARVLLLRSGCFLQTGQARNCCEDCSKVLTLRPDTSKALLNRGKVRVLRCAVLCYLCSPVQSSRGPPQTRHRHITT